MSTKPEDTNELLKALCKVEDIRRFKQDKDGKIDLKNGKTNLEKFQILLHNMANVENYLDTDERKEKAHKVLVTFGAGEFENFLIKRAGQIAYDKMLLENKDRNNLKNDNMDEARDNLARRAWTVVTSNIFEGTGPLKRPENFAMSKALTDPKAILQSINIKKPRT